MRNRTRLTKIDEALKRHRRTTHRIVAQQDLESENLFHGDDGETYTGEQLDGLTADGAQVVRIVYVKDWRGAHNAK